jgi:cellulose binding protein with CBM2 domain
LRLDSHQAAAIAPWKLDFDLSANITSIWNATISAHVGNHYTIVGANWNSSLAGGGSVSFGFVAGGNGASARPANYSLNGNALGTSTPPPLPSISIGSANESVAVSTAAMVPLLPSVTEARELMAFAQQKGIGRLAFWSLNRDQQNASGKINWVENTSSSLVQQPLEFSRIFNAITG